MKYFAFFILTILLSGCNFESEEKDLGDNFFAGNKPSENLIAVTPPVDKIYKENESILFKVSHPATLTVTGTPRLVLDVDGATAYANYLSGSNSKTLVFEYIVPAGVEDYSGVELIADLDLNGGTIQFDNNGVAVDSNTSIGDTTYSNVKIDSIVPAVTLVSPLAIPTSTLYFDQAIEITLAFSESVTITGAPTLEIDIEGTPKQLQLVSGNGTSNLFFRATVGGTELDLTGYAVTSLNLNGGTIQDAATNNADLTPATLANSMININGDQPYVKQVIPPPNDTYKPGEAIEVSLVFTEIVNVAAGIPKVDLDIGGVTREAQYISGSGTDTLLFRYIVVTGDADSDGILIQPAINFDGATIQDVGLFDSLAEINPPSTVNVLVEATLPEVISITPPIDKTYLEGEQLFFTLTYNTSVNVTGIPRVAILLNSNSPGLVYADYSSGTGTNNLIFRYVVSNTEEDLDGIEIRSPLEPNTGTIIGTNAVTASNILTTPISLIDSSNILVDAKNPEITAVAISPNANYTIGQEINLTITYHENVIVTGSPRVALDVGGSTEYAIYNTGASTSTDLVFTYLVGAADIDDNGIQIPSPTIDLNAGTISDSVALAGQLDFSVFAPDTTLINVNYEPPQIISITPPANQYYNETDVLGFTVNTNVPINISGGIPRIELDIGGQQAFATYLSGTGTTALYFALTLPQGLEDHDGITMVSPIQTNGSNLRDVIGNNLDLTFTLPDTTGVLIDSLVPYVVTITAPTPETYILNETVDFTLNYNENVSITGTPRIAIDVGGVTKYADYTSGDGTTSLLFQYTVISPDEDTNGISFVGTTLDLNGGTIQDIGTNDSNTNLGAFTALPNLSLVLVDAVIPTITSITLPADNTYIISNTVDFIVNFDDNVTITNTPRLAITLSTGTVYADYLSGSTTSAVTFRYTVLAGEEDLDGIELVSPLDLPVGALIQDINGNDATLTHTPPDSSGILIDGVIPTVTIDVSPTVSASNVSTYTISGTCSENGQDVNIDIGGVTDTAPCSALAWSTTTDVTAATESADNTVADLIITADHNDAGTNAAIQATATVIKDTIVPTISSNTIAADTYIIGDVIDMVLTFSENITPVGSETIDLTIGTATVTATQSATTANTITYSYTVLENDLDTDGIVGAASITGGVGIVDAVGNALNNIVPSTTFASSLVDGVRPTITNVTITAGTYGENDQIDIILTYDDAVTITGDIPELPLIFETPVGTPKALFTSGSATTSLTFSYTVTTGNEDTDGIDLSASIDLLTATAKDVNGNDAYLNLSSTNFPTVLVDAIAPIVAISTPADLSFINIASDSTAFAVAGTCNVAGQTIVIKVDGSTASNPTGLLCNGASFSGTIDTTGIAEGALVITAELTDLGNNTGISPNINITKDTVAPIIAIDPAINVNLANSTAYTLTGTCDEESATINLEFGNITDSSVTCSSGVFTKSAWDISAQADNASVNITADITDSAGNPGIQATTNVIKDTVLPTIAITTPADSTFILLADDSATYPVSGTCDESAASVVIKLDGAVATGQSIISCDGTNFTGTIDTTGYVDGVYAFTAELSDAVGNIGASLPNNVTKDTVLPTVAITSPTDGAYINIANDSAAFAVSGTCNESGQTVEIRVDGSAAAGQTGFSCDGTNFTGTIDSTGLTQGSLEFTAYLADAGGNDITSIGVNITKDTIAPVVTLTTPADLSTITAITDSNTFAASGSCDENTLVAELKVNGSLATSQTGFVCDGTNWTGTFDSTVIPNATGHLFTVEITDAAGNLTTSAANSVDKVSYTVALTSSPIINLANETNYIVTGTCSVDTEVVTVTVGGTEVATPTCTAGAFTTAAFDVSGATDGGAVTVEVAHGTSTDSTTVVKDTIAPLIAITAADDVNLANANVSSYSVSGTCDEDAATVNVAFGALTTTATCSTTSWSVTNWDVSAEADNASVSVTADIADAAGNPATQSTVSVIKDVEVPLVAITSPIQASFINSVSDSTSFAVSGTCSENGETVIIKLDGVLATSPVGMLCNGTTFSGTIDTTGLGEITYLMTAEISDASANTGVSANIAVTKDTVAPTVTIGAQGNIIQSNESSYPVSGTCSEDSGSIDVSVGGSTATGSCSSGAYSVNVNATSVTDGSNISISVTQTDDAGNTSTTVTTTVDKDTTGPTVAITYSPNIIPGNESNYFISGSCDENGEVVSVSISSINLSPVCTSNSWNSGSQDVSSIPDGAVTILASQTDAAGNTGSDTKNITKTTATPTVTITNAPNIDLSNQTSYVVSGICSQSGTIVSIDIGGISKTANCSGSSFSTTTTNVSGLADGVVTITADHSTATQDSVNIVKDAAAETVTISSAPDITSVNENSYTTSGTCSQNGSSVNLDIGGLPYTLSCTSGTWSSGPVDVSSLADATGILLTADHSTATQVTKTINKSTSTPTISFFSAPTTLSTSVSLNWELDTPGGFTIDDYIINYRLKGSTAWLLFSDGSSSNTFAEVTGLDASTIYEFRAKVIYDTTSESEWSAIAEAETKPEDTIFGPYSAMNVGGSTATTVAAFQNGTTITLNGAPLTTLNQGQTFAFTSAKYDIIDADKPIFTAGKRSSADQADKSANIAWNPAEWAGKSFSFNATRTSPQNLEVYAIEDAIIEVRQGATLLASATLTKGSGTTLAWSDYGSYQVESTGNILAYSLSTGGGDLQDPSPLIPGFTQIIGFPTASMTLTTFTDGTNYSAIHSNSVTATGSLNKSGDIRITPQGTGTLYQSESLLITADKKISGASFADSDGLCSAAFISTNLMKTKYILPTNSDYIAFASKIPGTIAVVNSAGTTTATLTLTRSGANTNAPYKVRLANPTAGQRFISTVPVGAWYQPNNYNSAADQDETLLYGTNE